MSDKNGLMTGKVINYVENCGLASSNVKALIQAGTTVVTIDLEFFQYEFVRQEYPIGSTVEISYNDGSWHFKGIREKSFTALTKAIQGVGRQALYIKKGMEGPAQGDVDEPAEMQGDIDFIISQIGTFDMGGRSDRSLKGMRWPERKPINCT